MKRFKKYLIIPLTVMSLVACSDFFDTIPNDDLTLETTFKSNTLTEQFLANVYSFVPDEFNQRMGANTSGAWTGGSSEAEYVWGFVASQVLNSGGLEPAHDLCKRFWDEYYKGISRASIFIENVDKCKEMPPLTRQYRKAEARALRAMYYFNLFKIYGPVVILGDKVISPDATFGEVQLPRNSVEECIDFIEKQLKMAADDLPVVADNNSLGRITRPIALAVRTQVLLYAASPLYNGGSDVYANMKNHDGKYLFPKEKSQKKWEIARDAMRDFIKEYVPSVYDLYRIDTDGKDYQPGSGKKIDAYMSYREVVRGDNLYNPEIIFYRLYNATSIFQYDLTPFHNGAPSPGYSGGCGKSMTQEMVDLYYTKNGLRITEDQEYINGISMSRKKYTDPVVPSRVFAKVNTLNQWVEREPRFYADVTFNNSVWLKTDPEEITTTLYYNGNSGKAVGQNNYSVTGYLVRKGAPLGDWSTSGDRACILMRLAEIYLNYAEALNECGDVDEAIKYVNYIRERAGIPEYGEGTDANGFERITISKDQDELRNRIRRERTIELAFENHRYFDVRRWCVADMATGDDWVYPAYHKGGEGGEMHGLDINNDPPLFFNNIVFEKRVFNKKHYLFPIPKDELSINSMLVQNTGWEIGAN
ncbi:RagB/SusD family nutrient uptake outer membrane protein [Coprobacter tertius]|uniref:RagB/SusD family nutrient uptake outer membrane protein n=1 Tax=Coprobacter tertius TaxID=2944915 RepID=A0ABT1MGJ1_9BACT|nr:RagB/SusD family nutrient uptake outer membrane protein [Coprobacter tertius]MCP9611491.1 RagB/SusD family nutrient uptake outer membrane protein [Coprobacter tertius]